MIDLDTTQSHKTIKVFLNELFLNLNLAPALNCLPYEVYS